MCYTNGFWGCKCLMGLRSEGRLCCRRIHEQDLWSHISSVYDVRSHVTQNIPSPLAPGRKALICDLFQHLCALDLQITSGFGSLISTADVCCVFPLTCWEDPADGRQRRSVRRTRCWWPSSMSHPSQNAPGCPAEGGSAESGLDS